jgi:hypothetical protein
MSHTILTFPETLRSKVSEDGFPHISFSMVRGEMGEFTDIHLFIPIGMASNDGMNYGSQNLGLVGAAARDKAIGGRLGTGGQKQKAGADFISQLTSRFKAGSGIGGGVASAFELKSGLIVNPYTAVTFEGVNVRSFEFAFKLVPTSKEESLIAHKIENAFRKYMYPKERGTGSLEYPPTFRIEFMAGGQPNKYMPRIIDTYLTTMSANYNATGNAFHENDGVLGAAPTEIDLTMTFQEVRAITRDDLYGADLVYKDGYDDAGHVVGDTADTPGEAAKYARDVSARAISRGAELAGGE